MPLPFRRAGRPQTPRRLLHEFGRSLTVIVDEEQLREAIPAKLREIAGGGRVIILLREPGGGYAPASARGVENGRLAEARFGPEERLIRWLKVNETPLVFGDNPGVMAYLSESERSRLEALGANACFPLVAMNRLTGFVLIGPKDEARGEPDAGVARRARARSRTDEKSAPELGGERRELLQNLCGQAALALENAALTREQRTRLRRMYRAERLATAGELAAGAAHEIRNPLAAIRSTIQYLQDGFPDANPKRKFFDTLIAEVDRINGIVEGLLSFARREEARFAPTDLGALLDQSLALVAARSRTQGVEVRRDLPAALSIEADADLLRQAVLNILINALQAMPDGGTLTVRAHRRPGGTAVVELEDTGAGIAPEHLERVLDPFFTTKPDGTGLGLSIAFGVVERHDGDLEIESTPGRGTLVRISLPERR